MMQNTTKKSGKIAASLCAALVIAVLGAYLAAIVFPLLKEVCEETMAVAILVIYGLVILAAIVGVLAALRQRLKEIEGGEEEDAKQY